MNLTTSVDKSKTLDTQGAEVFLGSTRKSYTDHLACPTMFPITLKSLCSQPQYDRGPEDTYQIHFGTYKDNRVAKRNIESTCGTPIDYDGEDPAVTPEIIAELIGKDVRFEAYASRSSTAEKPRFHLVFPFSGPETPARYAAILKVVKNRAKSVDLDYGPADGLISFSAPVVNGSTHEAHFKASYRSCGHVYINDLLSVEVDEIATAEPQKPPRSRGRPRKDSPYGKAGEAVAAHYDLQADSQNNTDTSTRWYCPICSDGKKGSSLVIAPNDFGSDRMHCHRCKYNLSAVDFVMKMEDHLAPPEEPLCSRIRAETLIRTWMDQETVFSRVRGTARPFLPTTLMPFEEVCAFNREKLDWFAQQEGPGLYVLASSTGSHKSTAAFETIVDQFHHGFRDGTLVLMTRYRKDVARLFAEFNALKIPIKTVLPATESDELTSQTSENWDRYKTSRRVIVTTAASRTLACNAHHFKNVVFNIIDEIVPAWEYANLRGDKGRVAEIELQGGKHEVRFDAYGNQYDFALGVSPIYKLAMREPVMILSATPDMTDLTSFKKAYPNLRVEIFEARTIDSALVTKRLSATPMSRTKATQLDENTNLLLGRGYAKELQPVVDRLRVDPNYRVLIGTVEALIPNMRATLRDLGIEDRVKVTHYGSTESTGTNVFADFDACYAFHTPRPPRYVARDQLLIARMPCAKEDVIAETNRMAQDQLAQLMGRIRITNKPVLLHVIADVMPTGWDPNDVTFDTGNFYKETPEVAALKKKLLELTNTRGGIAALCKSPEALYVSPEGKVLKLYPHKVKRFLAGALLLGMGATMAALAGCAAVEESAIHSDGPGLVDERVLLSKVAPLPRVAVGCEPLTGAVQPDPGCTERLSSPVAPAPDVANVIYGEAVLTIRATHTAPNTLEGRNNAATSTRDHNTSEGRDIGPLLVDNAGDKNFFPAGGDIPDLLFPDKSGDVAPREVSGNALPLEQLDEVPSVVDIADEHEARLLSPLYSLDNRGVPYRRAYDCLAVYLSVGCTRHRLSGRHMLDVDHDDLWLSQYTSIDKRFGLQSVDDWPDGRDREQAALVATVERGAGQANPVIRVAERPAKPKKAVGGDGVTVVDGHTVSDIGVGFLYAEVVDNTVRTHASKSARIILFENRNTFHPSSFKKVVFRASRSFATNVQWDLPSISTATFLLGSAMSTAIEYGSL